MPKHRDDTPEFDDTSGSDPASGDDPAPGLEAASEFDADSALDGLPSLPPESDLDIRPTGADSGGTPAPVDEPIDDAPWQRSELPPDQRRRRLIVLAVVAVAFVLGAAAWAFGFGRNLSGNFEAGTKRSEEAGLRESVVVVPEQDYRIDIDQCDVDAETGRVTVAGSLTLDKAGRAGTHQVLIAFVDGDEDVTAAEATDNLFLDGPESSAPIYALGDALNGHPNVDCVPLQVTRLIGASGRAGNPEGGS